MELRKLTGESVPGLVGRHIFLVRYFPDYLEELYAAFPELPFAEGIFDSDPARHGEKGFHGRTFRVSGMEGLKTLPEGAVLIITTGYFMEEYGIIKEAVSPDASGSPIYYFANRDTEYYQSYLRKYAEEPLRNLIVFRSGMGTREYVAGMDYTDNARALFEYLLLRGYNKKYEMVWLVKNPEEYRPVERQNANVSFVSYDWAISVREEEREAYYRAICLARYFFFTHACGFCRLPRAGQTRIQLWHGCGFKTVRNTMSQRGRYEYTTVISQMYAGLHRKEFGLDPGQLAVTGYAKEDWLFHPVQDWKARLGIPEAGHYIFWLPTYRAARSIVSYLDVKTASPSGLPIAGTLEELRELNCLLQQKDAVLVLKLHPLQRKEDIFGGGLSNIVILENEALAATGLHINQILGHGEALISDYSSAAVDFLLLDKPLAFTLDDLEEYEQGRGFILNPIEAWLPGERLVAFGDLVRFIRDVADGKDVVKQLRRELAGKFHDFHDDQNCRRIAQAFGL